MSELEAWLQEVIDTREYQEASERARKFYDTYSIFNESFQQYLKMTKRVDKVITTNRTDYLLNP